jgi:hypothetical protein
MEINNKLIQEVYGIKVKVVDWDDTSILYRYKNVFGGIIICDFIKLLKSYLVKKYNITLQSYTNKRGRGVCKVKKGDCLLLRVVSGETEEEAVIKAGEWVLNNVIIKQPKGNFKIRRKK